LLILGILYTVSLPSAPLFWEITPLLLGGLPVCLCFCYGFAFALSGN
jgi:hypothetical protein